MKKTVIVGASDNPTRYAYLAAEKLDHHGYEFVPLGIKRGKVLEKDILDIRNEPTIEGVDTITMYVNRHRQKDWVDYLLALKPKRIIFNPGAENPDFSEKAKGEGIEVEDACTLVMLSAGLF